MTAVTDPGYDGTLTLPECLKQAERYLAQPDTPSYGNDIGGGMAYMENMACIFAAGRGYMCVLARASCLDALLNALSVKIVGTSGSDTARLVAAKVVYACTASAFRTLRGIENYNPQSGERWLLRVKGSEAEPITVTVLSLRTESNTKRNPRVLVLVRMESADPNALQPVEGEYPIECFGPEPPKAVYFTRA